MVNAIAGNEHVLVESVCVSVLVCVCRCVSEWVCVCVTSAWKTLAAAWMLLDARCLLIYEHRLVSVCVYKCECMPV